jgi:succinate dehydrogenase / fumarate reductase flavoprotein subunit
MFDYITDYFRAETAETEEEADKWYGDKLNFRRTPDLLPRDEVARAINTEVKAGRGSPHGGVFLDIASRRAAEHIKRALPSMYHQFKQLADVDITATPMEVGPTAHYTMGGVRVEADTGAATVPGLFAAGECAGGMHGANRLGGNSLSDLVVFGRRAGIGAAEYALGLGSQPQVAEGDIAAVTAEMESYFGRLGSENPYAVQSDLQDMMHSLVGIIRTGSDLQEALGKLDALKARAEKAGVTGGKAYNPGWHLAMDLKSLLTVAEGIARAASERTESRGAHTRDDYKETDPEWGKWNLSLSQNADGTMKLEKTPLPQMPAELAGLFEEAG